MLLLEALITLGNTGKCGSPSDSVGRFSPSWKASVGRADCFSSVLNMS